MKPRHLDFSNINLYAVTPDVIDGGVIFNTIQKLVAGGVDAVQLRSRSLTDREMVALGKKIKVECEKRGVLFLIDNRADLALAIGADGIHLGHTDIPIGVAREILGYRRIIGASAHSLPQAIEVQKQGADYVSCGPIWATPTKPDYAPVGLGLIGLYRAALSVPFVAIGGINLSNVSEVISAGATSVAVVRALFDATDPEQAAHAFKERICPQKVEVSS